MPNLLYVGYVGASAISLGVDFTIFMLALKIGVPPAAAAACGYMVGIFCHWLVSSRFVFIAHVAKDARAHRQQQLLFVLSALGGLGITTAIVGLGSWCHVDPRIAKAVAIVVSFQATYLLRKKVVFAC